MSGHSKWSTIKRQKGVADSKRSAVFTKLARQISAAARDGKDPGMNFKLRLAIDRAKAANLPNDNIDRAIKSGSGEGKGGQMKDVSYEGFGPGQVAIIVNALTDNPNRTNAEIRSLFSKYGGTVGSPNSVSWMFQLRSLARVPITNLVNINREEFELQLIDAGAQDVTETDGELIIQAGPTDGTAIRDTLQARGVVPTEADLELVPNTTVAVDPNTQTRLHQLFEALEDHPDVTTLSSNEA